MTSTNMREQERKDELVAAPVDEVEEVLKANAYTRDYSGAQAKTDPREIALVRKLDLWIMPILWAMYWLNYLVSVASLAHAPAKG